MSDGLRLDQLLTRIQREHPSYEENAADREMDVEEALDQLAERPVGSVSEKDSNVDKMPLNSVVSDFAASELEASKQDMPSEAVKSPVEPISASGEEYVEESQKSRSMRHLARSPRPKTGIPERIRKEPRPKGEFSYIRDVPKILLDHMTPEFPSANNQTDLLVAYLVCHSDPEFQKEVMNVLTVEQKELIKKWKGKQGMSLEERLDKLSASISNMGFSMDMLEMMVSFMAFDRVGFRHSNPVQPRDIDFLENGVTDVMLRAVEQTKQLRSRMQIENGRPKS